MIGGAIAGAVVGVVCEWSRCAGNPDSRFNLSKVFGCSIAGAAVGLLPDVLEPATSPNHRAFFHSVAFSGLLGYVAQGPHTESWDPELRDLVQSAVAGYLSHSGLDLTWNPNGKGIPLIC